MVSTRELPDVKQGKMNTFQVPGGINHSSKYELCDFIIIE